MKQRPRHAENKIAEILNHIFTQHGLSPVERIPILGRTGPDLTTNEAGLAIDVKSRKACPIKHFRAAEKTGKASCDSYCAFTLDRLPQTLIEKRGGYGTFPESKLVTGWLDHMRAWVTEWMPAGIPGLVLHRPQMPYGKSLLILGLSDIGLLRERIARGTTIFLENGTVIKIKEEEKDRGVGKIIMTPDDLMAFTDWMKRRIQG